jgi:hypothetical protein
MAGRHQHWTLDSIPWQSLRRDLVSDSEELFYLLTTASFIESTTHLYAQNLIDHFSGDDEVTGWLRESWQPEELQHGRALRRYVQEAWPDFDWDGVYARFLEEFTPFCKPDALLPKRGLEMVSRCVVEMGTASYYSALSRATGDPVLQEVAHNIFEDEVRHYKYFYKFFLAYRETERPSRVRIAMALWHRLKMIEDEDSYIGLKYAYTARHPGKSFDAKVYKQVRRESQGVAARHFPHEMCVKMLLKPLGMQPWMLSIVQPIMEGVARRVVA